MDDKGNLLGHGADGCDGERAGDIHLFVGKVIDKSAPEIVNSLLERIDTVAREKIADGHATLRSRIRAYTADLPRRFICRGSNGQPSEPGGLTIRDIRPEETNEPRLLPVRLEHLTNCLRDSFGASEENWRWPAANGETNHAAGMPCADKFARNQVVHCRLLVYNDSIAVLSANEVTFPDGQKTGPGSQWISAMAGGAKTGVFPIERFNVDKNPLRPRSGADAFASGRASRGGDGGNVTSHLSSADIVGFCPDDALRAGTNADSLGIAGERPPMGEGPFYWINILVVRRDPIKDSFRKPEFQIVEVSPKAGNSTATVKIDEKTKPGQATTLFNSGEHWMHPTAVEAVLRCARDMYRFEQRKEARDLIGPYLEKLSILKQGPKGLTPDLECAYIEMQSMVTHMANNVDYFGNPIGWVPRLSASTNFGVWLNLRQTATRLLYFARQMQEDWDNLENAQRAVEETAKALKDEMKSALEELPDAHKTLDDSTQALKKVSMDCKLVEQKMELLRQEAAKVALEDMEERESIKAACQIVGGLLKLIPVGEPICGTIGDLVDSAGDIDWKKPLEGSTKLLDNLSEKTKTFLDEHSEAIKEHVESDLKKNIDDATFQIDDYDKSLKSHLEESENLISQYEEKIKAAETELSTATKDKKRGIEEQIEQLQLKAQVLEESLLDLDESSQNRELKALNRDKRANAHDIEEFEKARKKLEEDLETAIKKKTSDLALASADKKKELQESIKQTSSLKQGLSTNLESLKKKKEKRAEQTSKVLAQVKNTAEGLAGIGKGIATMMAHIEPDDPKLLELRDKMLASKQFGSRYAELLDSVDEVNKKKADVLERFCQAQQLIGTFNVQIARNVSELCVLSNQRQYLGGALDCGVKQYLAGMEGRAHERLIWAQYHFIKAFQYEHLKDVPKEFYDIENLVKKLQTAVEKAESDGATVKPGEKPTKPKLIDESTFQGIADNVFKDQIDGLATDILNKRQHRASAESILCPVWLTDSQLKRLQEAGYVTFKMVRDMNLFTEDKPQARIRSLKLTKLEIESPDPKLRLEIDFEHSGESILRDAGNREQGKYYFFQQGADDDPISWHAVWSRTEAGDSGTIRQATPVSSGDGEVDAVLKNALQDLKPQEYAPGYFSDITVWLNKNHFKDVKPSITAIKGLSFDIDVVYGS